MVTRLSASGRPASASTLSGRGSGSVFALRIFWAIASLSSDRLIRLMSDGSDFDIFARPSRRDMIRAALSATSGSGRVNKSTS